MVNKQLIRKQHRDRSEPLPLARRKELTALTDEINQLWAHSQKLEMLGLTLRQQRLNLAESKELGIRIEKLSIKAQSLLSQLAHKLQDIGAEIEPTYTPK